VNEIDLQVESNYKKQIEKLLNQWEKYYQLKDNEKYQKIILKISNQIDVLKRFKEDDDMIFYTTILKISIDWSLYTPNMELRHLNNLNYDTIQSSMRLFATFMLLGEDMIESIL